MKKIGIVVLLVMLLFISACSTSEQNTTENTQQQVNMAMEYNLDTQEWSPIMTEYGSEEALEAYAFAAEHPEVTDYMPCYCGCFESDGHTNNTACFIDSVDGNIAKLDSMGLGWGICIDIAREAKVEYEKGTDLKTIRELVDSKYGNNGVESTPTPMPQ